MTDDGIYGQSLADRPARDSGKGPGPVGRRVRDAVLGAAEQARANVATRKVIEREEARPALHRAGRSYRDAENRLGVLLLQFEDVCARWAVGTSGEDDVAAVEAEIEETQRDLMRCAAAIRALERKIGINRDHAGNNLSAYHG